jgi:thiol-disulfide isomerase/thioredoxin
MPEAMSFFRAPMIASLALLGLLGLLACEAPEPPTADGPARSSAAAGFGHSPPLAVPADSDPMVGYDLRRLRPRDDEPLASMFERVRAEALREQKRVVVLFSADWCEPCRHLDLELGNTHPTSMIGDVRVLELKEDDWVAVARMDEFNSLRRRWEPVLNTYPLLILLDAAGGRVEEMKEAKLRLEAAGLDPTLPVWFDMTRPTIPTG